MTEKTGIPLDGIVTDLKKQAKTLGIKGYSKMKKAVLQAAIDAALEEDDQ